MSSLVRTCSIVALSALAIWSSAAAQTLSLKRAPPPAPRVTPCPTFAKPSAPSPNNRDAAAKLSVAAQEASIVGDVRGARDQLRRAVTLDSSDASLAYHLAQSLDALHENGDAAREYCRYLALSPNAPEAAEVRSRIESISPPPPQLATSAGSQFKLAVSQYDAKRFHESELAFTSAIEQAPTWPESYYDRAMARIAQGSNQTATEDLQKYLQLRPEASDRPQVVSQIDALQRGSRDPGTALALGLIPGGGQYYTHRPVFGGIVTGATAAAVAYALIPSDVTETVSYTNPFGQPYTDTVTTKKRNHLGVGLGVAGALTIGAAIEAYFHAKNSRNEPTTNTVGSTRGNGASLLLSPTWTADAGVNGVQVGVSIPIR